MPAWLWTGAPGANGIPAGKITITMGTTSKQYDSGSAWMQLDLFGERLCHGRWHEGWRWCDATPH
jgi:hypothetical protein